MRVADVVAELERCDPQAQVRLAEQPAWPLVYAVDQHRLLIEVTVADESTVCLVGGSRSWRADGSATCRRRQALGW